MILVCVPYKVLRFHDHLSLLGCLRSARKNGHFYTKRNAGVLHLFVVVDANRQYHGDGRFLDGDGEKTWPWRQRRRGRFFFRAFVASVISLLVGRTVVTESSLFLAVNEGIKSTDNDISVLAGTIATSGNKSRIILRATVPPVLIERLYNETGHSTTSPLSPDYPGKLDPRMNNRHHNNTYRHCSPTGRIEIKQQELPSSSRWILQTFDQQGSPKDVGGDEFYVTFTNRNSNRTTVDRVTKKVTRHPNYVATVTDLGTGSYMLEFFSPPFVLPEWDTDDHFDIEQTGYVTIHLSFTCGMGLVTQKSDWKQLARGSVDWVLVQQDIPIPSWKPFTPPTFPVISNGKTRLSEYEYIAVFGDSHLGLFSGQYKANRKFNKYPRQPGQFPPKKRFLFVDNIRRPYAGNVQDLKDLFQKWHGEKLRKYVDKNESPSNAAIVLGAGSWDVGMITWTGGDVNFTLVDPTMEAYRNFWTWLLNEFPNIPIYWKAFSAVHPHVLHSLTHDPSTDPMIRKGTRYSTASRVQVFREARENLMRENEFKDRIGVLDVYHAAQLSADWLFPDDSSHLGWEMNSLMLMEWFYRNRRHNESAPVI